MERRFRPPEWASSGAPTPCSRRADTFTFGRHGRRVAGWPFVDEHRKNRAVPMRETVRVREETIGARYHPAEADPQAVCPFSSAPDCHHGATRRFCLQEGTTPCLSDSIVATLPAHCAACSSR